ncbi:testis-expressed protein 52 [Mixophyes fleayi]|uniref:testis-expressed protein 52 n=1 Tax=Mixophyes fleayi TaxID=3061075 RepID=UPI003F4DFCE7
MLSSPQPVPLLSDTPVHSFGFIPRGLHSLLLKRPPYTEAKLELLRKVRKPPSAQGPHAHTLGFLTWLEVSRLPPLQPLRPDKPYDSAVWRRLTSAPEINGPRKPIPPPSRMERNTWDKFVRCSGIRRDEREPRTLRLRSQGRVPPTDSQGNILPPEGFKRYPPPCIGTVAGSDLPTSVPVESGFFSPPKYQYKPHKLTLQENSPNYHLILQRYRELQGRARSIVPYNSRTDTPRTATQVTRG